MKNKISIIIPVRNEERRIAECLLSIAGQKIKNEVLNYEIEIICIDNNSNDETKKSILSCAEKFKNINYYFESKIGRGSARNAGIEKAEGDIIAMIDADCLAPPNWLEKLVKPIIAGKAEATMGFESDIINNYWSKIRQEEDWAFIQEKISGPYIEHLDTKNFAIKAEILKKIKFDPLLSSYEDWDLFINLRKIGVKILFLPELKVKHYHDSSLKELIKTQFSRGKSAALIHKKWQKDKEFQELFKNDPSAASVNWRNFIFFLPWALWQIILSPRKSLFIISADAAWKAGIIVFKFKRGRKNS